MREIEDVEKRQMGGKIKAYAGVSDLTDKLCLLVGTQVVLGDAVPITLSCLSKGCPQIGDLVVLGILCLVAFLAVGINRIIDCSQVPVVKQGHHDAKYIEFTCPHEGVTFPIPVAGFFALPRPLQANRLNRAIGTHQVLPPFEVVRHILHSGFAHKIILIGDESHRPHQACGRGLRTNLRPEFYFPLSTGGIAHFELRVCASPILFNECKWLFGLSTLTARSIEEIAGSNIEGVCPENDRRLRDRCNASVYSGSRLWEWERENHRQNQQ